MDTDTRGGGQQLLTRNNVATVQDDAMVITAIKCYTYPPRRPVSLSTVFLGEVVAVMVIIKVIFQFLSLLRTFSSY